MSEETIKWATVCEGTTRVPCGKREDNVSLFTIFPNVSTGLNTVVVTGVAGSMFFLPNQKEGFFI